MLLNSPKRWGAIAMAFHWLTAIAVAGMFALGLWMVDLAYYSAWYYRAPFIHKSIGLLLLASTALRLGWRLVTGSPNPLANHTRLEKTAAKAVHILLYVLLFGVMASGYLISTADGRAVAVFGLFEVPAILTGMERQADIAGRGHLILAVALAVVAALHALAALKHHFIDKDRTLKRMLGR